MQKALTRSLQAETLEEALEIFLELAISKHDIIRRLLQSQQREHLEKLFTTALEEYLSGVFRNKIGMKAIDADDLRTPTVLFWDKMRRYLFGTYEDYENQIKMSMKFSEDNSEYEAFVKRQIHLINEMNDDRKIDYFAMLTRCFLLTDMESALFYKLARFLSICTPEELEYIRAYDYDRKSSIDVMIHHRTDPQRIRWLRAGNAAIWRAGR